MGTSVLLIVPSATARTSVFLRLLLLAEHFRACQPRCGPLLRTERCQVLRESRQICHQIIWFFNRSLWRCYSIERTTLFTGHETFKEGLENVKDKPRRGKPVSSANQNVEMVQSSYGRLSVRTIEEEMGLNKKCSSQNLIDRLRVRKCRAQTVCASNSELVGSLSGFAGRIRNRAKLLGYVDEPWVFKVTQRENGKVSQEKFSSIEKKHKQADPGWKRRLSFSPTALVLFIFRTTSHTQPSLFYLSLLIVAIEIQGS